MPIETQSEPTNPPQRSWLLGMRRGAGGRCPNCGAGAAFAGYLRVVAHCGSCGHALGTYRADDAPPYFTIMAVGHIIVPLMLLLEKSQAPAMWIHMAVWLPATLVLSLALLRPIKGAVLGVIWATDAEGQAPS
jgi:uncharacterized protein (DUF983 family)